ncbi:hypothetical protein AVEN_106215-1 [Araneus ventricosus]|uniref:Transposase Tc1-like domain-containing protein n=1 Tax=Araneus ventricosus TaxID=182803 RepID=A0A4Y2JS32_ARAVE|nr:hypothetical protein AVEN_106215-1 [Araneus ventricosus]
MAREADPEARLQAKMSSSQIKDEMQLPCTSETIRNALHRNTDVVYKKFKMKPPRSKRRIDSCLNFERKHLRPGNDWRDVVFSNEKKLYLDGPNELKFDWFCMDKKTPFLVEMDVLWFGHICSLW